MSLEIDGQVQRGYVAVGQTALGLLVGLLALFVQVAPHIPIPARGAVSILLLMGQAVLTLVLRELEPLHRARVEAYEASKESDASSR